MALHAGESMLKTLVFLLVLFVPGTRMGTGAFRVPRWHPSTRQGFAPHGDQTEGCYFNAIYNLGDSMSDTGNLIHEGGIGGNYFGISKPPYGKDALDGKPTGRCSDGLLMVDFLAQDLGLPLLPAFLDKAANFTHGINFAVGGATALPFTFFQTHKIMPPLTQSSLDVQLGWLRAHANATFSSETQRREAFQRTLFMLGEIGVNDFNCGLLSSKPMEDVKAYVPEINAKITDAAQELIDMGAKYIVVLGNFPIGCLPSYLTAYGTNNTNAYDFRGCLKELNELAMYQNFHLMRALEDLRQQNLDKGVNIMYGDYYTAFMNLIRGARSLGFSQQYLLQACCGSKSNKYRFDMASMCGMPGSDVCSTPSRFVSWDGIHFTQHTFRVMEKMLTVGGLISAPDGSNLKKWICTKKLQH